MLIGIHNPQGLIYSSSMANNFNWRVGMAQGSVRPKGRKSRRNPWEISIANLYLASIHRSFMRRQSKHKGYLNHVTLWPANGFQNPRRYRLLINAHNRECTYTPTAGSVPKFGVDCQSGEHRLLQQQQLKHDSAAHSGLALVYSVERESGPK